VYICSQWAFIHALLSRVPLALAGLSCKITGHLKVLRSSGKLQLDDIEFQTKEALIQKAFADKEKQQ